MVNAQDINPATGKAYAINPNSNVWDDNYFDAQYGAKNRSEQQTLSAYDNLATTAKNATSDFAKTVSTNENAAFDDYLKTIQGMPTSVDFYNKQLEASGVPQMRKTQSTLQGQIYDLEDTLRRVEPDVTANTGNSVVTESQRRGIVTEKQKPLIENLGWLGQSVGRISGAITDATGQAVTLTGLNSQDQAKIVDAFKEKLNLAVKQGDRALSAFTTDINNVLNVTLGKIARQEKISDTEAANAFELLKLQKTAELNMQAENSRTETEIIEAGGRKLLIDKKTGKTIQDLGSSSSGASGGAGVDLSAYLPARASTGNADSSFSITNPIVRAFYGF